MGICWITTYFTKLIFKGSLNFHLTNKWTSLAFMPDTWKIYILHSHLSFKDWHTNLLEFLYPWKRFTISKDDRDFKELIFEGKKKFLVNLRNFSIAHLRKSTWWSKHNWLSMRTCKRRMSNILRRLLWILYLFMNRWQLRIDFSYIPSWLMASFG